MEECITIEKDIWGDTINKPLKAIEVFRGKNNIKAFLKTVKIDTVKVLHDKCVWDVRKCKSYSLLFV